MRRRGERWKWFFKSVWMGFILSLSVFVCYALALSPDDVLEMLKAGNARFVEQNLRSTCDCTGEECTACIDREWREENNCNLTTPEQLACLKAGQHPIATIISCSDSRIIPETIFDVGMEDIFVIRVAGNTIDKVALGSIEYGVAHAHTPLLVVLGHQHCGAVTATVNSIVEGEKPEGFIRFIVLRILRPALQAIRELGWPTNEEDKEKVIDKAIENNVRYVMKMIQKKSKVVRELVKEGKLKVVGAVVYMEGKEGVARPGEVVWLED